MHMLPFESDALFSESAYGLVVTMLCRIGLMNITNIDSRCSYVSLLDIRALGYPSKVSKVVDINFKLEYIHVYRKLECLLVVCMHRVEYPPLSLNGRCCRTW